MNKFLSIVLGILLGIGTANAIPSNVQRAVTFQNAVSATGNGTAYDVGVYTTLGFQVTITATATVVFEQTDDNSTFNTLLCALDSDATGALVSTTSTTGAYVCSIAGHAQVRVRVSVRTSGTITVKGIMTSAPTVKRGGSGAPVNATYITQTPNASLTNEQAMSSLGTGLELNTTGTGVQSIYGGTTCGSSLGSYQALIGLNNSGAGTGCMNIDVRTGPEYNIIKLGALNIPQNATNYASGLGVAPNATEASRQIAIGEYSIVHYLTIVLNTTVPASNSLVVTVRKNGVNTLLTCTIVATSNTCSNITNEITFEKGDLLSVKLVSSATFTGSIDAGIGLRLTALTGDGFSAPVNTGYGVPAIWYGIDSDLNTAFIGEFAHSGTEYVYNVPISASRIFNVGVANIVKVGNDRAGVAVRNNGVTVHNGVIASTAADTVAGVEGLPVLFADNDLLSLIEISGGIGTDTLNGYVRISSTTPLATYPHIPMLFSITSQAQNTTRYFGGWGNVGQSATENNVQFPMPISTCTLMNLRVSISLAPAAGQTYTVTVRIGGVDTAMTVQFTSASATTLSDTSNTVISTFNNLFSISSVASATAGTRTLNASIECAV